MDFKKIMTQLADIDSAEPKVITEAADPAKKKAAEKKKKAAEKKEAVADKAKKVKKVKAADKKEKAADDKKKIKAKKAKKEKVDEASEAQTAAREKFKAMVDGKKKDGDDDKKDEKKDEPKDEKDEPKDEKDDVKESFDASKLTFTELAKIVHESGGQQQIDAIDEALFAWAQRVAASKFDEGMKQEVFAGMIYERNGGIFKLHDVLTEGADSELDKEARKKKLMAINARQKKQKQDDEDEAGEFSVDGEWDESIESNSKKMDESAKYYDIESTLDKYSDSPSATKFLKGVVSKSSPDDFHAHDVQKAKELKAKDIKKDNK